MRSVSTFAALVLIVGAVLLVVPSFGFGLITADRGVSVGVVDEGNQSTALVGLASPDASIGGRHETAEAIHVINNFEATVTVDATATIDTEDVRIASSRWDDGSFSGIIEDSETVMLECRGGGSRGTATITVTIRSASSGSVTVEEATVTNTVPYHCRGNGGGGGGAFVSVSASDVSSFAGAETSQTFTFEPDERLHHRDSVEIDLSDPQAGVLNYENAEVVSASHGEATFDDDTNQLVYSPDSGNLDEQVMIELENVLIEERFSGESYTVTFERTDIEGVEETQFTSFRLFTTDE